MLTFITFFLYVHGLQSGLWVITGKPLDEKIKCNQDIIVYVVLVMLFVICSFAKYLAINGYNTITMLA
jgi:hypothetical protein